MQTGRARNLQVSQIKTSQNLVDQISIREKVLDEISVKKHYEKLLKLGINFALLIHSALIPLFFLLDIPILWISNIVIVVIYLVSLSLIEHQLYLAVIIICWLELTAHAFITVMTIGWESGFHYYLLFYIPLIFITPGNRLVTNLLKVIAICALYLTMDSLLRDASPSVILDNHVIDYLRYSNIIIVLTSLGLMTYFYIQAVYHVEKELMKYAITDPLTGLFNRRYVYQLVRYQEKMHKRESRPFSIILGDIDEFKRINDKYGHEVGDSILVSMSNILRDSIRDQDSIARWGGEEYLILLPNTALSEAIMVAGRLGEIVGSKTLRAGEDDIPMSMTFGVCEYDPEEGIDACINRADNALIKGKQAGKNRVVSG